MEKDKSSTVLVTTAAIMATLVCVTTMLIQVPIPATKGFFNIGDAMIMVAAFIFGPVVGAIAGGLGSSLADLLGGWYIWVLPTMIIKGVEGLLTGYIFLKFRDQNIPTILFAWIIGGLEMVLGYFITQVAMYGFTAALVELPFNFIQMTVGGIVGIPLSLALRKRINV